MTIRRYGDARRRVTVLVEYSYLERSRQPAAVQHRLSSATRLHRVRTTRLRSVAASEAKQGDDRAGDQGKSGPTRPGAVGGTPLHRLYSESCVRQGAINVK